MQGKAHVSMGK